MREWAEYNGCDCPKRAIMLLDHKYTLNSLSFEELKNKDKAKADLLRRAREIVREIPAWNVISAN